LYLSLTNIASSRLHVKRQAIYLAKSCVHYLLMLSFAVFFADEAAVGIIRVEASDAAAARHSWWPNPADG